MPKVLEFKETRQTASRLKRQNDLGNILALSIMANNNPFDALNYCNELKDQGFFNYYPDLFEIFYTFICFEIRNTVKAEELK